MKLIKDILKSELRKQWKVASNSKKGKYYTISLYKNNEIRCNCWANNHGKPCRHLRILENIIKENNYEEDY